METSTTGFKRATTTPEESDLITIPRHQFQEVIDTYLEAQRQALRYQDKDITESLKHNRVREHALGEHAAGNRKASMIVGAVAATVLTGGVGGIVIGVMGGFAAGEGLNIVSGTYSKLNRHSNAVGELTAQRDAVRQQMQNPQSILDSLFAKTANSNYGPDVRASHDTSGPAAGMAA